MDCTLTMLSHRSVVSLVYENRSQAYQIARCISTCYCLLYACNGDCLARLQLLSRAQPGLSCRVAVCSLAARDCEKRQG